jgi:4-hydroxy-tetrahydrodipicolinate synthase
MKKSLFSGTATALITPFNENGALDLEGLERLIEYQIEGNIQAIVLAGTTG